MLIISELQPFVDFAVRDQREIFQEKNFKNCAIVSSYMPDWKDRKNLLNEQILDCYKE